MNADDARLLRIAYDEAKAGFDEGGCPVGSVLARGGGLDPEWKEIIFKFQDRLMVGSDTWVNSQWDRYAGIMSSNRRWLSKLPRDVAEKIAYRNAEKLFGRKVSMGLIGRR